MNSSARRAQLRIRPHRPLATSANAFVAQGFGAFAVSISSAVVEGDVVVAEVIVGCNGADNAALLQAHLDDERLWHAFIGACFVGGACDVERSVVA